MGPTSLLRRFIAQLGAGEMFSTRDVLRLGQTRNAIDKALSRMVKDHVLERLTSGLFVRSSHRDAHSLEEIAEAKAKAFKRRIWMHGSEAEHQIGLSKARPDPAARQFSTDGPTSSFQVGAVRVFLKHVSMRKVQYQESPVGKTIAGFWSAGESGSTAEMFASAIASFNREQLMVLQQAIAVMPQWLTERIPDKQRWHRPVDQSITETICSSVDPYEEFDESEIDSSELPFELAHPASESDLNSS